MKHLLYSVYTKELLSNEQSEARKLSQDCKTKSLGSAYAKTSSEIPDFWVSPK